MADKFDQTRQDLAFLRALVADSGDGLRPLGAVLTIAGVVHAISALRIWAVTAGYLDWPQPFAEFMGVDALILQVAAMILYGRRNTARPPSTGPAARAVKGAIAALAWALAAGFLGLVAAGYRAGSSELLALGLPILLFALAGATWHVVYTVYRRAWAQAAALASLLFAAGAGFSAGAPSGSLVISAGLLICLAIPGCALMKHAEAN